MTRRTMCAALLALAVPGLALAQDKPVVAADAGARRLYSEVARTSLYVPARDGTRLAVHIYRPAVNGKAVDTPYPVVFAFGPYPTRQRLPDSSIAELAMTPHFGMKGLTDYWLRLRRLRLRAIRSGRRIADRNPVRSENGVMYRT